MTAWEKTGWLEWLEQMGVDEMIGDAPVNRFEEKAMAPETPPVAISESVPPRMPAPAAAIDLTRSSDQLISDAMTLAARCNTLEEIAQALESFEACPLKRTAANLCFTDGNPRSKILFMGEAPGRDEDLQGKPFVGRSGQLLDRMLAAIGFDRHDANPAKSVLISNTVFWRPPGNRKPTLNETEMCLPFVYRLIEIAEPQVIVCVGATPSQRLLRTEQGILRLRGKWMSLNHADRNIPVLPTLHPAYLLRQPAQKRLAWRDMLTLKIKLTNP